MKIAFVVGAFPALSETFILSQITGLIDRGHSVDIYAHGPSESPKCHPDVERYGLVERTFYMTPPISERLRDFVARSAAEPMQIWEAMRRRLQPPSKPAYFSGKGPLNSMPAFDYDIVHCHFGESGLTALRERRAGRLRGRLVTTFYGADLTQYIAQEGCDSYAELFNEGDVFLAICDYFRTRLIQFGCPADRIRKHTLGIDPTRFQFVPRRLRSGEPVRMVSIARLVEKKGIEYALRALATVRTSSPIEYTIIGDGPLRPQLENLARQLNANVTVRFSGWLNQDEVAAILRDAHLLVLPSVTASSGDQEGTPVAILEALASGLPVISTLHSGIPEQVQDGVSGRLVPERDAAALGAAIEQLVAAPETWVRLGEAGRAHVAAHHDIAKLNDELVGLYERLIEPAAHPRSTAPLLPVTSA